MTAIFILLAVGVQKAEAQWTLEQCIEFATRNNLYIKQMELRQKVAKTDLNAACTALLPNINAGIGQNWNLGRTQTQSGLYENQTQSNTNLSVSSSMTIFAGGRLINSIGKAKLDLQISKANLQKAKNDVSLRVTSLFFDVLLRKELLKIAEEQFRATLYQEKITKTLADNGKIPQSQIFDISAKKAKDTLAIVQADNNIKLALLELILTVEPTDIDGFDIADITPPNAETIDENYREPLPVPLQIYEQALNNKPEIKSATIGVASAQK
ncbi:MAG: TolC family protein, partial [Bacteroidetes bacterium]